MTAEMGDRVEVEFPDGDRIIAWRDGPAVWVPAAVEAAGEAGQTLKDRAYDLDPSDPGSTVEFLAGCAFALSMTGALAGLAYAALTGGN